MTNALSWRDVKARAREADPGWDSPERVARRAEMRTEMLASVNGRREVQGNGRM